MKNKLAPVQLILELSCSAYRTLGTYIKEHDFWFKDIDPKETPVNVPNKLLIQCTLGYFDWYDGFMPPKNLVITNEDIELADQIRSFYKRLAFKAINNEESFDTNIFSFLNSDEMKISDVGYMAYLPEKYRKEYSLNKIKKELTSCENQYLGNIGDPLFDLDSEIIDVTKSKNFDAYNVYAIINNKLCSWMTKKPLVVGPAVVVKAKIKEHSSHWKYGNRVTRLHYVSAAQ